MGSPGPAEAFLIPWGLQLRALGPCALEAAEGAGSKPRGPPSQLRPRAPGRRTPQSGWWVAALGRDMGCSSQEPAGCQDTSKVSRSLGWALVRMHHYRVEGKSRPSGAPVLGFPQPLASNKPKAGTGAQKWPWRVPSAWRGSVCCAVRSVHGICIPLIQLRQDLVHKFSRGNAFNKNLMGSGSSAESPYEFQVFAWSPAWAGAQPLQWGAGEGLRATTRPQPPVFLGRAGRASPHLVAGGLSEKELSPGPWGAQGIPTK